MDIQKETSALLALTPDQGARAYMADAIVQAGAVPADAPDASQIKSVGVIGAGAMGRGIALAFAYADRTVTIVDPSEQSRQGASKHIDRLIERQLAKGRLDAAGMADLKARIVISATMTDVAGVDMVVEAVPEIMGLKQKVLRELNDLCGPDTVLASNTSTLDIDEIAGATGAADRVIGTHFFIPAQVNRLLELVPGKQTSPQITALALALAHDINKNAVVAGNCDGFIGNRLFDRFHQEAMYLVEEGAWPQDVDRALESWGMAIGPFRALDLVGNDIPWGVRKQRATANPDIVQPRVGDALCEAGLYGQKTGKGWYLYDTETPRGRPYDGMRDVVGDVSKSLGLTRRDISAEEIVSRCVLALLREGWGIVEEGFAARASDIDMVYVTGYGFPAMRGGPMRLGDQFGRARAVAMIEYFGQQTGKADSIWNVPQAMRA